jgi:hypothetical protein
MGFVWLDEKDAVGRRYHRQDALGTPFFALLLIIKHCTIHPQNGDEMIEFLIAAIINLRRSFL